MKRTILSLSCLFFLATFTLAQDPDWHQVPKEDLLGNRGEIAKTIQATQDEKILLEIWQRPETDEGVLYLKMLAAKRLGLYGTKAAVPVLVPRLDNDKDGFYARYALETIPGTEVDVALGEALKTIKKPEVLAGILTTLGVRGNPVSAEVAASFLTHENADVRRAAGYAFAMTAMGDTLMTPFKNDKTVPFPVDSAFLLAEQFEQRGNKNQARFLYDAIMGGEAVVETVNGQAGKFVFSDLKEYQKMSAIYQATLMWGLDNVHIRLEAQLAPNAQRRLFEVGLKAGRELPDNAELNVAELLIALLDIQTDPLRKAKLVRSLGDRLDKESKAVALPVIAKLAEPGNHPAVRVAAIDALCNVGDSSVVPILIAAATQTEEKSVAAAAVNTLTNLPGKEVDAAISKLLETGTSGVKVIALGLIAERRIFSAAPMLVKLLQDSDASVSAAAISALGQISGIEDLPVLLGQLKQAKSPAETEKLLNVLKSACTRFSQDAAAAEVAKALDGSSPELKTQLLDLLKEVAGTKSLEIVNGYAWGDDAAMRNVATRILGEWRSPQDLEPLAAACLKLAKGPHEYQSRGVSAYIRLARQFTFPENQRLAMIKTAFETAERPEHKALIFDIFARYPSVPMVEAAMSYSSDEAFREQACKAAVDTAAKLQGRQPRAVRVLDEVLKLTQNADTKTQAESVRSRLAGVDEGIEIVKAIYGAGDKTADVTTKVRQLSAGSSVFEIGSYNTAFGDVAQGIVKTLKITYKVKGGPEKTVEFPENAPVVLPK